MASRIHWFPRHILLHCNTHTTSDDVVAVAVGLFQKEKFVSDPNPFLLHITDVVTFYPLVCSVCRV